MTHDLPDIAADADVIDLVKRALAEDTGALGDVTTRSLVPDDAKGTAQLIAREQCVVSGTTLAQLVFSTTNPDLHILTNITDGSVAEAKDVILTVKGSSASILTAERTALNFMQRMTGIATSTAAFVKAAEGSDLMILDTRKTTPCLRKLEKYSVLCGGGSNHRFGLFDRILIKDNHRKLWGGGSLGDAVTAARKAYPDLQVEIEVESTDELRDALHGSPDWVLLDNMSCENMTACVSIAAGQCKLEASGGIGLSDIPAVARSGVDAVSLGCLTHTIRSADLSLEFI